LVERLIGIGHASVQGLLLTIMDAGTHLSQALADLLVVALVLLDTFCDAVRVARLKGVHQHHP
jgi:hypothetical protein